MDSNAFLLMSSLNTSVTQAWTINSFRVNINCCEILNTHLVLKNERHLYNMVENPKITIYNSSFGSLDLQPGTEADVTNCNIDAKFRSKDSIIRANNATIRILNCTFIRFQSERNPTILHGSHNTSVYIERSMLSRNRGRFGVIFLNDNCTIKMKDVNVTGNMKCISTLVFWNNVVATIHNSTFRENEALFGGGFWVRNSSFAKCINVIFQENEALQGGAVSAQNDSRLVLVNSILMNNIVTVRKHEVIHMFAPYNRKSSSFFSSFLLFAMSLFEEIKTNAIGGAIIAANYCEITLESCSFMNNVATAGGAIGAQGNVKINIIHCEFKQNEATKENGGAMWINSKVKLNVQKSQFMQNYAKRLGGAIFGSGIVIIGTCNFTENYAADGGAVSIQTNSSVLSTYSQYSVNRAKVGGGAIRLMDQVTSYISGCNFSNNSAHLGGALSLENDVTSSIRGCNFYDNKVEESGGAVNAHCDVKLIIQESKFSRNHASLFGGAINGLSTITLQLDNDNFTGNYAEQGGVMNIRQNSTFIAINSNFTDNGAKGKGGAIVLSNQTISNLMICNFKNNTAQKGGAIALRNDVKININKSYFDDNNATFGGAILLEDHVASNLSQCKFYGNQADWGGALHASIHVELNIQTSQFIYNNANLHGGTVWGYNMVMLHLNTANFTTN